LYREACFENVFLKLFFNIELWLKGGFLYVLLRISLKFQDGFPEAFFLIFHQKVPLSSKLTRVLVQAFKYLKLFLPAAAI